MSESYPIQDLGTSVIQTVADKPTVPTDNKPSSIPVESVPNTTPKTSEQVLTDTINGYTEQALKWFGLLNTPENVSKVQAHLSRLINSLKEI